MAERFVPEVLVAGQALGTRLVCVKRMTHGSFVEEQILNDTSPRSNAKRNIFKEIWRGIHAKQCFKQ